MRKKKLSTDEHGFTQMKNKNSKFKINNSKLKILILSLLICGMFFLFLSIFKTQKTSAEDAASEVEKAIFTKQEFFGASANVPLPTADARENLQKLTETQPNNILILQKLADANEKLERFDEAETIFKRLAKIDEKNFSDLADFYERRGRFDEQGEILHQILKSSPPEHRAFVFEKLLETARRHDLKKYKSADFFAEIAKDNADVYDVFARLIEKFEKEENYEEALNFVHQAKAQFPEQAKTLLEKEVELFLDLGKSAEAEAVYQKAFNPFWTEKEEQDFYDFLDRQDRLRAYGAEVKRDLKPTIPILMQASGSRFFRITITGAAMTTSRRSF